MDLNIKKKITLNARKLWNFSRLILGFLIHSKKKIKFIGDKSLLKRDFKRIIKTFK